MRSLQRAARPKSQTQRRAVLLVKVSAVGIPPSSRRWGRDHVSGAETSGPPPRMCRRAGLFSDARLVLTKRCLGRVTSSPRLSAEKLEGEKPRNVSTDTQQILPRQTQNSPARSYSTDRSSRSLKILVKNERRQALDGLRDGRLKRSTFLTVETQCGQRLALRPATTGTGSPRSV